jgi:hypothetical protein
MAKSRRKPDAADSAGSPVASGQVRAYAYRALSISPPVPKNAPQSRVVVTFTEDEARSVALFSAWHGVTVSQLIRHLTVQNVPPVTLAVPVTEAPAPPPSIDAMREKYQAQCQANVAALKAALGPEVEAA